MLAFVIALRSARPTLSFVAPFAVVLALALGAEAGALARSQRMAASRGETPILPPLEKEGEAPLLLELGGEGDSVASEDHAVAEARFGRMRRLCAASSLPTPAVLVLAVLLLSPILPPDGFGSGLGSPPASMYSAYSAFDMALHGMAAY